MPLPLLIPLALAIASAASNYAGQRKVDKSRAAAMRMERERRERLSKRSDAAAKSTADLLTDQGEKARAAELTQKYQSAPQIPAATGESLPSRVASVLAPATSATTVRETGRAQDRAGAYAAQQARARAGLESFGDVMVDRQLGVNRNLQDISQVNQSLENWNRYVLPAQMAAANAAGRNWNTLADVFQIASQFTTPFALAKGPPAGGSVSAGEVLPTPLWEQPPPGPWAPPKGVPYRLPWQM